MIGQIALKEIDWEHKNAVIGCIVHYPFWRQGFGTEMILAILDYAFNELKLHRVLIDPQSNNYKFCGLLEKYGFHFEGIKKEIFLVDNKYYDQSEYSILEQDWPTVRQSMLDSI